MEDGFVPNAWAERCKSFRSLRPVKYTWGDCDLRHLPPAQVLSSSGSREFGNVKLLLQINLLGCPVALSVMRAMF